MKALIVRNGHLGDIILSTCVIEPLQKAGYSQIDWLSNSRIYELSPWLSSCQNTYVILPRKNILLQWQLLSEIRKEKYDLCVILETSSRYHSMVWFSGAKSVATYYERPYCRFGASHAMQWNHNSSIVENNMNLIRPFAPAAANLNAPKLSAPRKNNSSQILKLLSDFPENIIRIVIHPGSSSPLFRSWPFQHYVSLMNLLIERQNNVIFIISGTDKECNSFREIPNLPRKSIVFLENSMSINDMCTLINGADLFISADTGPMHIAAALSRPQVALYGPTSPSDTGPMNPEALIVESKWECRSCTFIDEKEKDRMKCISNGVARCYLELIPEYVAENMAKKWGDSTNILSAGKIKKVLPSII